jgi:CRISPR-associated endonuclease/helicase Cas3
MTGSGVDLDDDWPDLRAFWGKAGRTRREERTVPHPLVCHLIDTAVVAELLFDVVVGSACRTELEQAFEPVGDGRVWTAFMCGLHCQRRPKTDPLSTAEN